jgi:hypothetical protein
MGIFGFKRKGKTPKAPNQPPKPVPTAKDTNERSSPIEPQTPPGIQGTVEEPNKASSPPSPPPYTTDALQAPTPIESPSPLAHTGMALGVLLDTDPTTGTHGRTSPELFRSKVDVHETLDGNDKEREVSAPPEPIEESEPAGALTVLR